MEATETIANNGSADLDVWIEPWGDCVVLPAGGQIVVSGHSTHDGQFELERRESSVVLYGWPGCTLTVRDGDVVIRTFDNPVPAIPPACPCGTS
jgi:hypothetical protein